MTFESLQKVAFLCSDWIALAVFRLQILHTQGMLHNPHPKSVRPGVCWSICSWVPFPLETGVRLGHSLVPRLCPNMETRAEKIPQYRCDSSLSCMIMVALYLFCSVNVYLVNKDYIWILKIRKLIWTGEKKILTLTIAQIIYFSLLFCLLTAAALVVFCKESEVYNLGAKVPAKNELEIKDHSFALQKKDELTVNSYFTD